MKIFKLVLIILIACFLISLVYNYPKLNIISGYSAKNMASSIFIGKRSLNYTSNNDNNFSPINLANETVDYKNKTVFSNALGLLKRKAVYREGLGCVLVPSDYIINKEHLVPNRCTPDRVTPFPYGNAEPKDSVFDNINYQKLKSVMNEIFEPKNKTRAALVIYKDHIIAERYADSINSSSRFLGWSMTKSLASTLFGVLQYQGKIDLNENNLFKAWKNDERKDITINNLLQMNSGLAWSEDYESISDVTKMLYLEEDVTTIQINKPLIGKPNASWLYSSGTSNILSGILRRKFNTHQEYLDFWYTDLIDKIGMNSMVVEADVKGNYIASSYAWATTRDWAKLGLLYLHNGNWNGTKLFTKDWVDYATTPTPTSDNGYGAQIWLNAGGLYPNVSKKMYSFNGYQGQYVFIFPEQDLVVVRLGLTKNIEWNDVLSKISSSIK